MTQLGIPCPNCGCVESTSVERSMLAPDARKRYRKCFKCGTSFPTVERVEPETPESVYHKKRMKEAREERPPKAQAQLLMQNLLEKQAAFSTSGK